ncbi:MAG: single-stranded DNA-binding protein [Bacteroidales bacterium]|nr:single-stranded DNA-binding protein [Bacteroidales bacterium]MDD4064027.1 single-stranded DNA-binding protein [Bacteroidales bacterium]MDD4499744.1 single-stranded DNA-binding protein [Bacteroidales bacterium]
MLNKVMLIGNVGKDPEIRHLESGTAVANITLATTERYKDRNGELQEQTEWHNVVLWRGLADVTERFVRKGSQIFIEGKIRSRSWEDQSGQKRYTTEIVADNMQLLGRRSDNPANAPARGESSANNTQPGRKDQSSFDNGSTDFSPEEVDDLPF